MTAVNSCLMRAAASESREREKNQEVVHSSPNKIADGVYMSYWIRLGLEIPTITHLAHCGVNTRCLTCFTQCASIT